MFKLADELENTPRIRLGISAERYLMGFFPGYFSDEDGNYPYLDNELHHEILEAFDYQYQLVGGAACDALYPKTGYQFANDELMESGLALALIETGLGRGMAMGHGFRPRSEEYISVDRLAADEKCGNQVACLDGKPAAERLEELKQQGLWPAGERVLGRRAGDDYRLIVPLHCYQGKDGIIALNRDVAVGDRLYVMQASAEEMGEATKLAIEQARFDTGAATPDLNLILIFSCAGRFQKYAQEEEGGWVAMAQRIGEDYPGIPIVGVLCAGEFGSATRRQQRSNNMSVSVCCVTSKRDPQLETRELQDKLLRAAENLAQCKSPEEVMRLAIEGAVNAGAAGGMICLVDQAVGRILGKKGFGYACSPENSPHDWPRVADLTDRPAPTQVGGRFPSELREWSVPVQHDISLENVAFLEDEEDVLTLVARTLQAIFVADIRQPRFHCDQTAGDAGNIRTFLAIPLVGFHETPLDHLMDHTSNRHHDVPQGDSRAEAIATLQVSFPDDHLIDRESFGFWIGYAQKVGAALKRTQESWERETFETVNGVANDLLQEPVRLDSGQFSWCNRYLESVKESLCSDDVHMRVLGNRRNEREQAFRLVGAVGLTASLRRRTRLVTRAGDGSCNLGLLREGGWVTNTKEETEKLNRNVKTRADAGEDGRKFTEQLAELEASAMLPVRHLGEVHGSFVIDSRSRYFFTARRQRLARTFANLAGAIHLAKAAEYARAKLEREQKWMLETLTGATEGRAEGRLRRVLARVCNEVNADVASLYVWHTESARLVLHVARNWYEKGMEGIAFYARREGWTGELADSEVDVKIVHSGPMESGQCSKKHYGVMVPPQHQVNDGESEARIGVRLGTDQELVGVVTFSYYRENSDKLVEEDEEVVAFLRGVTHLITLGVEADSQENSRAQTERLLATKDQVARRLIAAAAPGATWQGVVDEIRKGFCVERVTLYRVKKEMLHHEWTSADPRQLRVEIQTGPIDPSGDLLRLLREKVEFLVRSDRDRSPTAWPNMEQVRTLYAVPVLSSDGDVHGVLELVNRIAQRDHPFEFLNGDERSAVEDVARLLGAAMDHQERLRTEMEWQSKFETAVKIGTTSLLGGLVMHRLMSCFSRTGQSINWLKRRPNLKIEDGMQHLHRIETGYNEALEMVQRTAHAGAPKHEKTNVRAIVQAALRVVRPELPRSGIQVKLRNETSVAVRLDVFSVVGALVNFLSNAIEALKGEGILTIHTSLSESGETAVIRIHNSRPTLGEADIQRAFAPGFTTKQGQGHFGIGIPLALRAIKESGGTASMHSPMQGGVEVKIELPVADEVRLS